MNQIRLVTNYINRQKYPIILRSNLIKSVKLPRARIDQIRLLLVHAGFMKILQPGIYQRLCKIENWQAKWTYLRKF